ncbi:MAG TPA: SDR family NAD(P)-dependent oxidoreductase [Euzebyales bacterium]|nr:SDR family NAD(P)-dependent oxidoreductase [Euzebyales bacterium]
MAVRVATVRAGTFVSSDLALYGAQRVGRAEGSSHMVRIVLVTGGNRGIGREVVRQVVAAGDTALLGARNVVQSREVATALADGAGRCEIVPLDVADPAGINRAARHVTNAHGRLDVLINNAAIHYDTHQRGVDADLRIVEEALQTNLLGAWRVIQAFLPLLRRSTHPRIVNVSSQSGSLASMGGGTPAYSVSKAALNALTRVLADELRSDGVLVNAVCPGWTATDMGGRGGRPVADGAASVMWAVDLSDDGPTGGFFRDGRPLPW